jgi:hypothetical protein
VRDSRAVDRGLLQDGEAIVVVARGAVGPDLMQPVRQLGRTPSPRQAAPAMRP